jgi:hypothetical protein
MRIAPKILVGKQGKIPLGMPMKRWENNIKTDLREFELDING